ncbi:hypothetical protein ACTHPF_02605 [Paenibacillus sp. SAF-054]|uniref:hypothetical protein n=1 Tax=unclassified Paenibacillus TaxID=185978 RepID=UPI003F7F15D2
MTNQRVRMDKYLIRKIIAALLSAVVFCGFLAAYYWISRPSSASAPSTYSYRFRELFVIYMMYAVPVYLVFGTGVSMLVDVWRSRWIRRHEGRRLGLAVAVLLHAAAGALLFILFIGYADTGSVSGLGLVTILRSGLFGAAAAVIYWALDALLAAFFRTRRR